MISIFFSICAFIFTIIPTTKNAGLFANTLHNNQDYKKVYTLYKLLKNKYD